MPKRYFVTAIGTGCGKTVVSAILTEALQADYWKPVQSGMDDIDRMTVQSLVANPKSVFHPERYLLRTPVSPHAAARIDGVEIQLEDFRLPVTNNNLIIEGAGGVLVPLNDRGGMVIDLAVKFDAEVILVSNIYLGSINHTLLTINELRSRGVRIKGLVFNGESNPESENFILNHSKLPCLFRLEIIQSMQLNAIGAIASRIKL
ncbi:MAG: dethiobiotin synthase [Cytophagales bacterium]|nr:dethiobiotin synthase [Cytophagales bacterium]